MNNNLKKRISTIALAGTMVLNANAASLAEDVSVNDEDITIEDLIPHYEEEVAAGNITVWEDAPAADTPVSEITGIEDPDVEEPYTGEPIYIDVPTIQEDPVVEEPVSEEECTHTYNSTPDSVSSITDPTCTVDGEYYNIYYCTKCGHAEYEYVKVAAPGHNFYSYEIANQTSEGYDIVWHCSHKGCNETKVEHHSYEVTPTPVPTTYPTPVPTAVPTPVPTGKPGVVGTDHPETCDSYTIKDLAKHLYFMCYGVAGVAITAGLYRKLNKKSKVKTKKLTK